MVGIETALNLVNSALGIWQSREKTKYSDKLIELDKEMREALSERPLDQARLDNLYQETESYIKAVAREMGK